MKSSQPSKCSNAFILAIAISPSKPALKPLGTRAETGYSLSLYQKKNFQPLTG
jgi:hypothetical protein